MMADNIDTENEVFYLRVSAISKTVYPTQELVHPNSKQSANKLVQTKKEKDIQIYIMKVKLGKWPYQSKFEEIKLKFSRVKSQSINLIYKGFGICENNRWNFFDFFKF